MSPFSFFVVLGLSFAGAYGAYAFWQSDKVPQTISIEKIEVFKNSPPMLCALSNSQNTVSGTIHAFHDSARFDIVSTVGGPEVDVHLIVNREGNTFFWQEGNKVGAQGEYERVFKTIGLGAITKVECKPWWIPYGGLFIPPQDTAFSASL